jgi:hypothetical protein
MAKYWIVVQPTNLQLYDALCQALAEQPGVSVIKDRRGGGPRPFPDEDRRTATTWQGDGLLIAEQAVGTPGDRQREEWK